MLWFPAGAGKPHLYEICVSILSGEKILTEKRFSYGIRKAEIKYTEEIGKKGDFAVYVNGKSVRVRGAIIRRWTFSTVRTGKNVRKR